MNKKKVVGYVMTGALSIGLIGGAGMNAFAASKDTSASASKTEEAVNVKAKAPLDDATRQKVDKIMEELKTNLSKIGVELPGKGDRPDRFANLDEATKAKVQAIMDKEKAGTITREEAHTQLKKLGLKGGPGRGGHGDPFSNLDEATKAKVQAIMDKEKAGTITREEAHTQLEKLGLKGPGRGEHKDPFANLDEATKAKAQTYVKDAQEKLEKLGVKHFPFGHFGE